MPHNPGRPIILSLIGVLWPGSHSSGPAQSYRATAAALASDYCFRFIARDRPFGAVAGIVDQGRWHDQGFAEGRFCAPARFGAEGLPRLLAETPHDLLWLNGFFDREFTLPALVLRRMGRIPARPTILSPRGEFSGGALGLKALRKAAYIRVARSAGLLSDVWLNATSEDELADLRRGFPWARGHPLAPIIRLPLAPARNRAPEPGLCRLAFVGRIASVKNVDLALRALALVRSRVRFDIWGPRSEPAYWEMCARLISALPAHVTVRQMGEFANDAAPTIMADTDLLFLPSKSENFGHAIFEALSCHVPVLIGDQTPWQRLEAQSAGWALPLDSVEPFAAAIDRFAAMGPEERQRLASGARAAAERFVAGSDAVARTRQMIEAALAEGAVRARGS